MTDFRTADTVVLMESTDILQAWGQAIRVKRRERGLTQVTFASLIGTSQAALSRYEQGDVEPPLYLRLRIARALDVAHDELFDLKEPA